MFSRGPMLRSVGTKLPIIYIVTPEGQIRGRRFAPNTGNTRGASPIEVSDDGRTARIRPEYAERGYVELRALYDNDPNPTLQEHGFAEYVKHDNAARAGLLPSKPTGEPNTAEGVTMNWAKLPDEWLPKEVHDRRAGRSAVTKPMWSAPKVPKAPRAPKAEPSPDA
jgi:hypothetical protein